MVRLASRGEPRQPHGVGLGTITRSRGRYGGNGLREGFLRVEPGTAVAAASSSSAALSFQIVQFEFHPIEQPRLAFAALTVGLTPARASL
jgi:hypothetical protein